MTEKLTQAVIDAAQKSHIKWGCPASVCLAQYGLESVWGTKLSGQNNPFGIKATASQPATVKTTHENTSKGVVTIQARFRDFASIDEAFDAHGKLLATGAAYAAARAAAANPDNFANALTGHYATDPAYGAKLISLMDQNNLYVYDAGQPRMPMPKPAAPTATKAKAGAVVASASAATVAVVVSQAAPGNHAILWLLGVAALAALVVAVILHFVHVKED